MDQRPLAARLEAWLLEPASAVRSVEERSRARLLALLTLGGIVAVSGAEAAFWHARDGHVLNWHAFVMLVPAYVFARRGRLRASALLTAYVLPVAALVRVSTGVAFHPLVPLTTLVLPPLVAAIVLRRRDVLILVAVEMVVPLVLVVLVPDAFPEPLVVAAPMALTFIAGVLVLAFMSHRDALERLRQQDLRAREARLRAVMANVPGAVYRLAGGPERRVSHVSDGVRDLAGCGPEDFLGAAARRLDDLIHADDRPRVARERERSLGASGSYALEYRLVRPDGAVRWVLDRGRVVHDDETGEDCVDGVLIDVSLRQAAVAETQRLAAVVETTSDFVSTARPDGRLRYLNRAGRHLLGWGDGEDVASRGIRDVHPDWAYDIVVGEGIPTALRHGVWSGETAILGADGREIPVSQVIVAHPSPSGEPDYLSTIMRDLTEQVAVAEARRESEERFRLLASASFEGIAVTEEGLVVDANEQLAAMLAIDRADLIGRAVMDFVAPESRPEVLDHLRRGSEAAYEHMAQRADGSAFPVEIRARTIPGGHRPQRVTILRDLTRRKRVEEERVALERRALHVQKLESLGVLAGGIAHDFNNLLVAVLGNLDLAGVDLPPEAPARRHLERAEHAARQGAALARELLAYSGRGRFDVRPLDLSALVDEMGQLLRAAIHRSIRLETRLERPLPNVLGDASQLQQVIMNLIVNAAEAVGEAAGTIVLATGVDELGADALEGSRIPAKPPPGRFVRVEVADDGCGMTPDVVERLFDPFFSTKLAGRGLGMAAVLGIVQGHSGAILVDSAAGRGTTFRVLLPLATPEAIAASAAPEARSAEAPAPARRGGLALIVDDEPGVLEAAQGMVEQLGFATVTASDGREAVELFRRVGPQIAFVLLDLTMPGMDGLETLVELRRLRSDVKVLLASGYDATEISERCGADRPDAFLQKPYRLATLASVVAGVARP